MMSWRPARAFARDGRTPGTAARRTVWWSRPPPWSEAMAGTRIGIPAAKEDGQSDAWLQEGLPPRGQTIDPERSRVYMRGHAFHRARYDTDPDRPRSDPEGQGEAGRARRRCRDPRSGGEDAGVDVSGARHWPRRAAGRTQPATYHDRSDGGQQAGADDSDQSGDRGAG